MAGKRAAYFVTGTDTDAGKTFVSCGILQAAARAGLSTAAIKPLAAGAEETPDGLRNGDALALQRCSTLPLSYGQVNPVCFPEPIAPHIAAQRAGRRLSAQRLAGFCRGVLMQGADLTLVEGAGGWKVPLSDRELLSQLARELDLPVILVVGMRLGCLNHALLTAQAILADRLPLAGWIANRVDPGMDCYEENRDTLEALLPGPLLAEIPHYAEQGSDCADAIDIGGFFASA